MKRQGLRLENGDVLALASKILALAEGRIVKLSEIKPSDKAKKLACEFAIASELAQLIMQEAEKVYGGVEKAVLTLKNGVLTPNAGIDNKNVPENTVVLWPKTLRIGRKKLEKK
jgi:F420-0:gamma-glutamyl ligase